MYNDVVIISCSGAEHIDIKSTIPHISKYFKNGEVYVELQEGINDKRVFIIQSFKLPNTHLLELLLTIDAAKRGGAREINIIIPYFPYCRMDKKHRSGVPISAKVVADVISTMNVNRIVTFDLHAEQIQGFFSNKIDFCHVQMGGFFTAHMKERYIDFGMSNWVFCAPDSGSVKRTKELALLSNNQNLCNMIKYRIKDQEVDSMLIIGDVKNKNVVVFDDMIDTGGTLSKAIDILLDEGAENITVMATHGILSEPAYDRLNSLLADVYIANSLPLPNIDYENVVNVLPLRSFIENIIDRIVNHQRLGDLCSKYELTKYDLIST